MARKETYNDYIEALQAVGDDLEDIDGAVFIAIRNALKEWVEETAVEAIDLLSRPNWLLSQYIGSKVVEYLTDRKVLALAGFRFRDKSNRFADGKETHKNKRGQTVRAYIPDPGFYGRFFEGGQRKGGRPYSTRAHFLREAKTTNLASLKDLIDKAFDQAKQDLLAGKIDEFRRARKSRGGDSIQ